MTVEDLVETSGDYLSTSRMLTNRIGPVQLEDTEATAIVNSFCIIPDHIVFRAYRLLLLYIGAFTKMKVSIRGFHLGLIATKTSSWRLGCSGSPIRIIRARWV